MGWCGERGRRVARYGTTMLLVLLAGCAPRLGLEALRVRWHRVPLADARGDDALPPAWRRKIELVEAVRRFAPTLGLDAGEDFATFTRLELDHPGYRLTASPRTSLQPYAWWAPSLEAVPYKGFVDLRLANDEAALLEHRGYDTYLRVASTFRTFGWLPTPLLDQHLRRNDVSLVRLVLREIQRRSLHLPGTRAFAFNESFATFVGHRGAIAFLEAQDPEDPLARRAHVEWKAERRYGAYLLRLAAALQEAYRGATDEESALAAKARLLETAARDLRALSAHYATLGIPALRVPRNNAALLCDLHRTSGLDLFETVHARTRDLRRTITLITAAAEARPDAPYAAIRETLTDGGPVPLVLEPPPVAQVVLEAGAAGSSQETVNEPARPRPLGQQPGRPEVHEPGGDAGDPSEIDR